MKIAKYPGIEFPNIKFRILNENDILDKDDLILWGNNKEWQTLSRYTWKNLSVRNAFGGCIAIRPIKDYSIII